MVGSDTITVCNAAKFHNRMASHTHQELLNYTNLKARALKVPELDPRHGVSGTRLIFFLFTFIRQTPHSILLENVVWYQHKI